MSSYYPRWMLAQTLISLALWGAMLWGLTTVLWLCSHDWPPLAREIAMYDS